MDIGRWWRIWDYVALAVFVFTGVAYRLSFPVRQVLEFQVPRAQLLPICPDNPVPVLRVGKAELRFKGRSLGDAELEQRIHEHYDRSPAKLILLDVSGAVTYGEVITLTGRLRGAGVKVFVIGRPGPCGPDGSWYPRID